MMLFRIIDNTGKVLWEGHEYCSSFSENMSDQQITNRILSNAIRNQIINRRQAQCALLGITEC